MAAFCWGGFGSEIGSSTLATTGSGGGAGAGVSFLGGSGGAGNYWFSLKNRCLFWSGPLPQQAAC